jgi:hypothetical protein
MPKRKTNPSSGLDRASGLQEVNTLGIPRKSADEYGKIDSPTHQPHLLPRRYL